MGMKWKEHLKVKTSEGFGEGVIKEAEQGFIRICLQARLLVSSAASLQLWKLGNRSLFTYPTWSFNRDIFYAVKTVVILVQCSIVMMWKQR